MKKILVILLCLPLFTFAQQTYVPDDNFEQVLINLGYDSILDDSVLTANIDTVLNLSISNTNISDLTGIEDFSALTNLNCRSNQLTSLDVSQNTALTILNCRSNQLTSLDVSQNTALIDLNCRSNLITSLDLRQNSVLTFIYCNNNNLFSLDFRNGNNTSVINVNFLANNSLQCISVDDSVYSTANWTNVDSWTSFSVNCNPVYGCTDSTALNFNPNADTDDGSCIAVVLGCTDSTAFNYNANANTDDGSCISLPENLFFSEHAEGNGSNRYLEIYNPNADTIELTNYALGRVSNTPDNGAGIYEDWVDFDSGAVILPNDVYIVAHSAADALILAESDMTYNSLSTGDDGFGLIYGINPGTPTTPSNGNYQILDWIGDWMGDPGQGWTVAGVNSATRNHTLVRKCAINQGDTSWTNAAGTNAINSQWIVLPQNDWTNIGFHNICICDSTTNSYTTITDTLCNGLSIVVGNNTYDSTGVYSDTLLAFNGCDSIITTNLTVLSSSISNITNNTIICDGDSIIVGSNVYNTTGSYTDTLVNTAGCDSIITTNLTVQTPTYQDITICDGDSISVGSSIYNSSGNYTDTITSSFGCDSIVYTNLTIYSQSLISGGIPNNTVGGGSYFSGSQHLELSCYTASELVSAIIYSDDTTLTTFEIRDNNGIVLDSVTANIIPGGHRIYFNYTMSAGASYELGVSGASDGLFRNNSGVNYPYNFANAAAVTSSSAGGSYYYFFYDIHVNALSNAAFTTNYAFCDGDSITISGNTYTISGLYTDSLTSSIGCDSIIYSNVVVSPHVTYTNNQTICNGETYQINGNSYNSTGTYIDSLTTISGCDSIVTTNLYVDSITGGTGVNNQTICIGDSIMVGSSIYYNDGIYNDTLVSSNGCDSIVTTTLSVITANYATLSGGALDTSVTAGDYSNYDGSLLLDVNILSLLKSATVYAMDTNIVTFELRDDNGVVLQDVTHTVYPGAQSLIFNFMLQTGTDYQLGIDGGNSGLYRNNAGTGNSLAYPFNIGPVSITSSIAGDQYYYFYYDIEIMPYATYIFRNICDGDSITIGNNVYNSPGQYTDLFTANNSCDSTVFTIIDFYQSPTLSIETTPNPPEICLGESIMLEASPGFAYYSWSNGLTVSIITEMPTVDTQYIVEAEDSNGCILREDIWVYVDSCISGVNNLSLENEIELYPNPASEEVTINLPENATNIKIYNMLGKLMFEDNKIQGDKSINIDTKKWKSNTYSVKLYDKSKIIGNQLFNIIK